MRNTMIRETIAGLGGGILFLVLLFQGMTWWLCLALSFGSYFAIRMMFPPDHKKVVAVLPENISQQEFNNFISRCKSSLSLVREDSANIKKLSLRKTVAHLCDLGDDLVVNFEKDPADVRVAQALPNRLERLHKILTDYIELAGQRNQSSQTLRALAATEKAVTKAVGKFEQIHHRMMENDAIDLSTSAKTFDSLLDFD